MPAKKTNLEFIEDCKKVHGEKYRYDKCLYKGNRIKVSITCLKHGDFEQLPHNHLNGKGCIVCVGSKKYDFSSFIEKSKIIHNDYYDYEFVNFINTKTKVKIKCPKHGLFEQTPTKHLNGSGCHKCGGSLRSNIDDFILKSNLKHSYKYDYKLVNYKNNKTKVEIICKEHGIFLITPSNHLKGTGCSKCSKKKKPSNEEFIKKSNKVHNNLYEYSNVNYINYKTEVIITCKKHGIFRQTPSSHLRGSGCPKCKFSKAERLIERYLVLNSINYETQFKFDDLKYKKELKFDFVIYDSNKNIKFLLEYNGEQHYFFRGQFGMKEKLYDEIILRDKMKIDYCIKNGIDIHIIKYSDDINSRLNDIFYLKN